MFFVVGLNVVEETHTHTKRRKKKKKKHTHTHAHTTHGNQIKKKITLTLTLTPTLTLTLTGPLTTILTDICCQATTTVLILRNVCPYRLEEEPNQEEAIKNQSGRRHTEPIRYKT